MAKNSKINRKKNMQNQITMSSEILFKIPAKISVKCKVINSNLCFYFNVFSEDE